MAADTKRVQFVTGIASSEDWAYAPGQVVDLPADRADAFIAGGTAVAVAVEDGPARRAPETAAIEPTENTALPRSRKRQAGE